MKRNEIVFKVTKIMSMGKEEVWRFQYRITPLENNSEPVWTTALSNEPSQENWLISNEQFRNQLALELRHLLKKCKDEHKHYRFIYNDKLDTCGAFFRTEGGEQYGPYIDHELEITAADRQLFAEALFIVKENMR